MIYLAINCTSSLECKTPYYWGFTMWETLVILIQEYYISISFKYKKLCAYVFP